jgi:hypothetical protein
VLPKEQAGGSLKRDQPVSSAEVLKSLTLQQNKVWESWIFLQEK